jgi:hypothetical protein
MNNDGSSAAGAGFIFLALYCLFIVAIVGFQIFLFWRIFAKTGQSGAMSLIGLIPGVGLFVLLCILAFGTWPIELRQDPRMMSGMPPAPGYAPQMGQPMPPYTQQPPQYPPYPPQ